MSESSAMNYSFPQDELSSESLNVPLDDNLENQIPDRLSHCRIFNPHEDKKADFLAWWKTTRWYTINHPKTEHTKTLLVNWGSEKSSNCWEFYYEGATIIQGDPKLVCKQCFGTLAHPGPDHGGTSNMRAHLKTMQCKKKAKFRGVRQALVTDNLQIKVCFLNSSGDY